MKITYLFGAGASANSIPTSEKFNAQLRLFLDSLAASHGRLTPPDRSTQQRDFDGMLTKLLQESELLYRELIEYTGMDLYARQLYLTGQTTKNRQFKALVSAFLNFYQLENKPDNRYDQFIANVLDKNEKGEINFPAELLFLSWNYDIQFELALAKYKNQFHEDKLQELINLYPRVQLHEIEREMLNKFSLIKLNGTAAGIMPDDSSYLPLELVLKRDDISDAGSLRNIRLSEAILHYHRCSDPTSLIASDIMNSWEITPIQKKMRSYLKYKSYNTDILIIIGYSFPTFNRRIDREVLLNLQLVKEVCIQAPANDIAGIAERFYALFGPERVMGMGKSNNPVKVRLVEMNSPGLDDEFYIPFQATSF